MLEIFTGVPGSGKTYYAVDKVYNCFVDDKHKDFNKFNRFYTNINEFHFETFNKDKEIAFLLNFDEIKKSIYELRLLYLQKNPDSVLIEKAKELNLYDTLFIIDEAQNYFADQNDVLIWWLSYHRHLHQDIILITQNISLIHKKYLSFGEFFYRAVPSSLRLLSHVFSYKQFVSPQLYKNSFTSAIKIKFRSSVYALYGSGANTQPKKVIYKFIIIAIVTLFVVIFGFMFMSSSYGGKTTDLNASKPIDKASPPPVDLGNSFTVVCVDYECSLMGKTFLMNDFNRYITQYHLKPVSTVSSSDGVLLRTFAKSDQFFNEVLNAPISSNSSH